MLTKGITKRLDLPHEPGEWIEVRMLGYVDLDRARGVRMFDQIKIFKELGPSMAQAAPAATVEPVPDAPVVERDPLADYDRNVLLEAAIVAWSYGPKPTADLIHSLDDTTADYVARQVVAKPETEADRKNA